MNGVFSAHPSPAAVRPLLGAVLLQLIAAGLVIAAGAAGSAGLRFLVGCVSALALAALSVAILGEVEDRSPWRVRRHGR